MLATPLLGVASDVDHTEVLVPTPLVPALEACHGPSEYSVVSDDESEAGRPYEPDSPPTPKGGGVRFVPSDIDLDGPLMDAYCVPMPQGHYTARSSN